MIDEIDFVDIFEFFVTKYSFRFRILDESRFEFNSADNLSKDIDFAKKIKKSEKNDKRNSSNKESKNKIDDEKKEFLYYCDENVMSKMNMIV